MDKIKFIWDNRKEKANIAKHGVSFEEATTVFFDEYAIEYFDPDHSDDEDRFILFGISRNLRLLVVCYCYRENDTIVRIISARKATQRESSNYRGKGRLK